MEVKDENLKKNTEMENSEIWWKNRWTKKNLFKKNIMRLKVQNRWTWLSFHCTDTHIH